MTAAEWWIEAEGRVWGPYPQARLAVFVAEGRLTVSTLVAAAPTGPFAPAALQPELLRMFTGGEAGSAARALLVVADVRATGPDAVEAALRLYGEAVRVRPGLWLVRARLSPGALRNALSRRLQPGEMLMVVEAPAADAAWFNLDGETDRALRRLWGGPPSDG